MASGVPPMLPEEGRALPRPFRRTIPGHAQPCSAPLEARPSHRYHLQLTEGRVDGEGGVASLGGRVDIRKALRLDGPVSVALIVRAPMDDQKVLQSC